MTQPFPLYDNLLDITSKSTNVVDWKQLAFTINSLTPDQCEVIFALIYHHHQLSETPKVPGSSFRTKKEPGLPYAGKPFDGGKGLLYTTSNFPVQLQQIIAEYVKNVS